MITQFEILEIAVKSDRDRINSIPRDQRTETDWDELKESDVIFDVLHSLKTGSKCNAVLSLFRREPGAGSLYFKAEKYPSDES